MALAWGGYTLGMWGYTRLMGYQISLLQLVKPGAYTGAWPPPLYPASSNSGSSSGSSGSQGFQSGGGNTGSILSPPQESI